MPKLPPPSEGNRTFPSGTYKVQLQKYEHTQASTGMPQIKWSCKVVEPAEFDGAPITDFTAMSDAAVWRVSNLVAGFGVKFQPGIDTSSNFFDQLCDACLGRTAYWRNELGKDKNGTDRNNIRGFEVDTEQEVIEPTPEDDATPESVKATWNE